MKNRLNTVIISLTAILTAFAATVLPFRLFDALTQTQMRIILFAEVAVYLSIFCLVFLKKEKVAERKSKENELQRRHNERIEKRSCEMQGLKIRDYDFAA